MKQETEIKEIDDKLYEEVKDEIVLKVINDLSQRSIKGFEKYQTTLNDNNHQKMLQHAYEEVLDLGNYLKKILVQNNEIQDLIHQYPNDQELGEIIRATYGKKA